MAVRNPPMWIAAGCYTDADMRANAMAVAGVTTGSGVISLGNPVDPNAMIVSAPGGMAVSVAPGKAWVQGTDAAGQGAYLVDNPTATSVTITTAHATLPRIDKIVAKVNDPAYTGSGTATWSLIAVAGTPAGSPVAPATPASSLPLATVAVAAATGAIVAGNITDARPHWSPPYPRGIIAIVENTSASADIATGVPVSVPELTITLAGLIKSGRRYRVRVELLLSDVGGTSPESSIQIVFLGGTSLTRNFDLRPIYGTDLLEAETIELGSTLITNGNTSVIVGYIGTAGGNVTTTITSGRRSQFYIEDVGPV